MKYKLLVGDGRCFLHRFDRLIAVNNKKLIYETRYDNNKINFHLQWMNLKKTNIGLGGREVSR